MILLIKFMIFGSIKVFNENRDSHDGRSSKIYSVFVMGSTTIYLTLQLWHQHKI